MLNNTDKIRHLNDAFRRSFIGGQVMLTLGIRSKSEKEVADILERVRTFSNFNKGNNPYNEKDFSSFDYNGDRIIWKIDYYSSSDMRYGSDNPADPNKTTRIMTIMCADEF